MSAKKEQVLSLLMELEDFHALPKDRRLNAVQLKRYAKSLMRYELHQVEGAVDWCCENIKWMPKLPEILDAIHGYKHAARKLSQDPVAVQLMRFAEDKIRLKDRYHRHGVLDVAGFRRLIGQYQTLGFEENARHLELRFKSYQKNIGRDLQPPPLALQLFETSQTQKEEVCHA